MPDALFRTNKPADRDPVGETAEVIRENRASLDTFISTNFYWSDSAGSAGQTRLSHNSPGGWRVYYGPRSEVSNPNRPGTAMFISDETRLLMFSSDTSHVMGGNRVVFSQPWNGWNFTASEQILIDSGRVNAGAPGQDAVSFNTTFGAPPKVIVQVVMSAAGAANTIEAHYVANAHAITTTGFNLDVDDASGTGASDATVFWRSEGTKPVAT